MSELPEDAYVMTVAGPVPASTLGMTLVHEHLLVDFLEHESVRAHLAAAASDDKWTQTLSLANLYDMRWNSMEYEYALGLRDFEQAKEAMILFADHGGGTIVDVTPMGAGRNPSALRSLMESTGVSVVMGTGYLNHEFHPPDLATMSSSEIAAALVDEVRKGVGPDAVRPGIIGEIGLSWPLHQREAEVLEAAVLTQVETGMPMTIHPGRHHEAPLQAVDEVRHLGGDLSKVAIGHLDRTLFTMLDYVTLAETGVYVELDLFGQESRHYQMGDIDLPNDGGRISVIVELFNRGFGNRVLVSHDISSPVRLAANGGEGYHHLLARVLPVMERRGLTRADLDLLTVHNPAEFLAVNTAAEVG